MMIPALVKFCCLVGSFAIKPYSPPEVIFLRPDSPSINIALPDTIFTINPRYTNPDQSGGRKPLTYDVFSVKAKVWEENLSLGSHLISIEKPDFDSLTTLCPFCIEGLSVIQVVKKKHEGYIGFLEEMLNVPFVLPPRLLPGAGHQSDLRLGVDCAEMAIYARRRQGYQVPYVGPRGIHDFLEKTDSLHAGTVLHFGHQVSVLYEDKGTVGELDKEDLLIHAYRDKAEIVELGKTDLNVDACDWYQWKNP